MAKELGFDVIPSVQFAMTPGDYTAQCLTLKDSRRQLRLSRQHRRLEHLRAQGVQDGRRRTCSSWAMSGAWTRTPPRPRAMPPTAWCSPCAPASSGMATRPAWRPDRRSPRSPGGDDTYRPVHYLAGVCSAIYMIEAMEWAAKNGGVTGANVAKGHVPEEGLGARRHGRRLPALDLDRGGPSRADERQLYRMSVSGATDGAGRRAGEERHRQDGQGQDRRASAQAGYAGLVAPPSPMGRALRKARGYGVAR